MDYGLRVRVAMPGLKKCGRSGQTSSATSSEDPSLSRNSNPACFQSVGFRYSGDWQKKGCRRGKMSSEISGENPSLSGTPNPACSGRED